MLNLPEYKGQSRLQFASMLRRHNPALDLKSSRRTARLVITGQYAKPFRKSKYSKEFLDAIEILKAGRAL